VIYFLLVVAPLLCGFAGAFLGRSSYDLMFFFISRTPRWRRFDRAMYRLVRR
jgi:hypothetical protein